MKRSVYLDTGINRVEELKDNIIILRLVTKGQIKFQNSIVILAGKLINRCKFENESNLEFHIAPLLFINCLIL